MKVCINNLLLAHTSCVTHLQASFNQLYFSNILLSSFVLAVAPLIWIDLLLYDCFPAALIIWTSNWTVAIEREHDICGLVHDIGRYRGAWQYRLISSLSDILSRKWKSFWYPTSNVHNVSLLPPVSIKLFQLTMLFILKLACTASCAHQHNR